MGKPKLKGDFVVGTSRGITTHDPNPRVTVKMYKSEHWRDKTITETSLLHFNEAAKKKCFNSRDDKTATISFSLEDMVLLIKKQARHEGGYVISYGDSYNGRSGVQIRIPKSLVTSFPIIRAEKDKAEIIYYDKDEIYIFLGTPEEFGKV